VGGLGIRFSSPQPHPGGVPADASRWYVDSAIDDQEQLRTILAQAASVITETRIDE